MAPASTHAPRADAEFDLDVRLSPVIRHAPAGAVAEPPTDAGCPAPPPSDPWKATCFCGPQRR